MWKFLRVFKTSFQLFSGRLKHLHISIFPHLHISISPHLHILQPMTFLVIIIILALVFDYINGFHDAANSIATIVSTKVLTPFQAVLWAALFKFAAFFIPRYVIKKFRIGNTIASSLHPEFINLEVIFSGLIAAICWNLLTWWFGIPSSSSHTLLGGFMGAA